MKLELQHHCFLESDEFGLRPSPLGLQSEVLKNIILICKFKMLSNNQEALKVRTCEIIFKLLVNSYSIAFKRSNENYYNDFLNESLKVYLYKHVILCVKLHNKHR